MSVQIQGDMLALDGNLCRTIRSQAAAFQARFPSHRIELIARIAEEFDGLKGHRVRCELRTAISDRQQIIVREARKSAEDAINAAFSEIKKKFRQTRLKLNSRSDDETPSSPESAPVPNPPRHRLPPQQVA